MSNGQQWEYLRITVDSTPGGLDFLDIQLVNLGADGFELCGWAHKDPTAIGLHGWTAIFKRPGTKKPGPKGGEGNPKRPAWHPDPEGRHEFRAWNGRYWGAQVMDGSEVSIDVPGS